MQSFQNCTKVFWGALKGFCSKFKQLEKTIFEIFQEKSSFFLKK
jgi:hypothetical protein